MWRVLGILAIIIASTVSFANVGTISFTNNTVPAGGYLCDSTGGGACGGTNGYVTPDAAGNKIFAR